MAYEPKLGEVCIFENDKLGHDRAPDHRGYIVAHRDIKAGEKLSIALWTGNRASARSFGGRIADMDADKRAPRALTDLFGNPIDDNKRGR